MLSPARNDTATQTSLRLLRLHELASRRAMSRLATGRRITRAADDPAGLIAANQLSASIAALEAESRVAARASAVVSTADASLGEASSLLTEAKRLAVANGDSTLSPEERAANQAQIDSIVNSVNRIGNTTQFNGTRLLDGNLTVSVTGAAVTVDALASSAIGKTEVDGIDRTLADVTTVGSLSTGQSAGAAEGATAVIEKAIRDVATSRARIGAFQANTLEVRSNALGVALENLSAARSAIEDADYAAVTAEAFRADILSGATFLLLGRGRALARRSRLNLLA